MHTKNRIAGAIASGPAINPETMAPRVDVRCRSTGKIMTDPMML